MASLIAGNKGKQHKSGSLIAGDLILANDTRGDRETASLEIHFYKDYPCFMVLPPEVLQIEDYCALVSNTILQQKYMK